jgi:hypothetical protein
MLVGDPRSVTKMISSTQLDRDASLVRPPSYRWGKPQATRDRGTADVACHFNAPTAGFEVQVLCAALGLYRILVCKRYSLFADYEVLVSPTRQVLQAHHHSASVPHERAQTNQVLA